MTSQAARTDEEMVDESAIDTTSGSNYQDAVESSVINALVDTTIDLSLNETYRSGEEAANNSSFVDIDVAKSSSVKSADTTLSRSSASNLPPIDADALLAIEREATQVARDFYKLNKQLQLSLNHISAASVCCLQTYRDAVDKMCNTVDECVDEEAILIAKAIEMSRTMEPIQKLQAKIASIKSVLAALETQI